MYWENNFTTTRKHKFPNLLLGTKTPNHEWDTNRKGYTPEVRKANLQCLVRGSDIDEPMSSYTTPESAPSTIDLASDTICRYVTSNEVTTNLATPKFVKVSATGSIGAISSSSHKL